MRGVAQVWIQIDNTFSYRLGWTDLDFALSSGHKKLIFESVRMDFPGFLTGIPTPEFLTGSLFGNSFQVPEGALS